MIDDNDENVSIHVTYWRLGLQC